MNKEKFVSQILDEMKLPEKRYQNPFIVTLSGYSGSGKSHIARMLSKQLSLYIVSGDMVRQKLYHNDTVSHDFDDIQVITNDVCEKEIRKLLDCNVSVIIDRSVSSVKTMQRMKEYGVPVYMIEITSRDEQNIERILKRNHGKENMKHEGYGDIESYSGVMFREDYMEIKERKIYDIPSNLFDYHIDGTKSLEEVLADAEKIGQDIECRISE